MTRLAALFLALAMAGLGAGQRLGHVAGQYAQAAGTSSSSGNGSSSGTSSNGSSNATSNGSSSNRGTSNATSNGGTSSSGAGGPGGTTATTAPPTGGTTPSTTGPAIPQPVTTTSVPPSRVREGSPTSCGAGTAAGVLCFDVGNADGVDAVRIPNGAGGFVVVPIVAAPVVAVDSGTSTSAASNVDLRVGVDVRTGDVVRVERRTDSRRQLALATIGILLLAVIAAASVSTWIRVRRLEGR